MLITHVAGNAQKQFTIYELQPATRYCVQIKFENNKDLFSPLSQEKCVTSPSTSKYWYILEFGCTRVGACVLLNELGHITKVKFMHLSRIFS